MVGRWPLTPKIDRGTWLFLIQQGDMVLSDSDMRTKKIMTLDIAFLKFDREQGDCLATETCDIAIS